jgi:hypothetical protein
MRKAHVAATRKLKLPVAAIRKVERLVRKKARLLVAAIKKQKLLAVATKKVKPKARKKLKALAAKVPVAATRPS